jgi:hypothetical protein
MIPRTPTKGKFCIIAEGPVNVGLGALQMSVAKMKGKRATATLLLAFGQLQNSVAEARGCFLPDRSGPPAIWTSCRHVFPMVRSLAGMAITTGLRTPHGSSWIQTIGSQSTAASAESVRRSNSGVAVSKRFRNGRGHSLSMQCGSRRVTDIKGIERPTLGRGEMEVLLISPANHFSHNGSDNVDSAGLKTPDDIAVHCILVYIQTKEAHRGYAWAGTICSTAASSVAMSVSISSRLAW